MINIFMKAPLVTTDISMITGIFMTADTLRRCTLKSIVLMVQTKDAGTATLTRKQAIAGYGTVSVAADKLAKAPMAKAWNEAERNVGA